MNVLCVQRWKEFGKGIYFALESGDKLILTRTDAGVEVFMYNAGKAMAGEPGFATIRSSGKRH